MSLRRDRTRYTQGSRSLGADGVTMHQGRTLGGSTFASFDREAVQLLQDEGAKAADPADQIAD